MMKNSEITDEQIVENIKEILENPQLRKCQQCANADEECSWCSQLKKRLAKWMYAGHCKFFETHEERIIAQTRQALSRYEKEQKKINHLLTMSINSLEMSMLFLDDFEERVEREYKNAEAKGVGDARVRKADRQWISALKRASKAMNNHIEGVRKQYQHMVMPIFNKVFFDKDSGSYDVESYDDHQSDVFELAEYTLNYFDVAFLNDGNARKIKETMREMRNESRILEDNDYKRYNFRR
jgi:hypothetical protein